MFSFFKKQKVSINSVEVPDFGWKVLQKNSSVIQWINPEETTAISVNFFNRPPDIPTIKDLDLLRATYRKGISSANGGLIKVVIGKIKDIPVAKTIFKIPEEPSGMSYLASLTIPFEDCSFVIKVQCVEAGSTGMRDAVIATTLMASGELTIGENGYENWFSDPYDPDFKDGTLMNKSEQEIYDSQFPNHPLAQARKLIEKIANEVNFKSEIEKLSVLSR